MKRFIVLISLLLIGLVSYSQTEEIFTNVQINKSLTVKEDLKVEGKFQRDYVVSNTDSILYVSSLTGSDANPGTHAEPLQSIKRAMILFPDLFEGDAKATVQLIGGGKYYLSDFLEELKNFTSTVRIIGASEVLDTLENPVLEVGNDWRVNFDNTDIDTLDFKGKALGYETLFNYSLPAAFGTYPIHTNGTGHVIVPNIVTQANLDSKGAIITQVTDTLVLDTRVYELTNVNLICLFLDIPNGVGNGYPFFYECHTLALYYNFINSVPPVGVDSDIGSCMHWYNSNNITIGRNSFNYVPSYSAGEFIELNNCIDGFITGNVFEPTGIYCQGLDLRDSYGTDVRSNVFNWINGAAVKTEGSNTQIGDTYASRVLAVIRSEESKFDYYSSYDSGGITEFRVDSVNYIWMQSSSGNSDGYFVHLRNAYVTEEGDGLLDYKIFPFVTNYINAESNQHVIIGQDEYIDHNADNFAVLDTFRVDSVALLPDSTSIGGITIKEFIAISRVDYDSMFNKPYVNVMDYPFNAVGDGVTNDRTAITNAIAYANSVNKNLYFPTGTYLITNTSAISITLTQPIKIFGDGPNNTILKSNNSSTIFYSNGVDNINFENLTFEGSNKNDAFANQRGVYLRDADRYSFTNCDFKNFAESGVRIYITNDFAGGSINNCGIYDNDIGILADNGGEYVNILGCRINGNNYGFSVDGGNYTLANSIVTENGIGIEFKYGSNDSHSSITGCLINHNLTWGIKCDSIHKGLTFTGNNVFANNILLDESEGVIFVGNDFGACDIFFSGSLGTMFNSNTIFTGVTFNDDYLGKTSYTSYFGNTYSDASIQGKIKGIYELKSSTISDTALVIQNKNGISNIIMYSDGLLKARSIDIPDTLRTGVLVTPYDNTIYVAKTGGDYTTIEAALASITDNNVLNRYVILVAPGIYNENNPLLGKEYVTIKALGNNNNVRITASNPNEDLFVSTDLFYIEGVSLYGVVGAEKFAIRMSVAGESVIKDVVFVDCHNGLICEHPDASVNILTSALYTIDADMRRGIKIDSGNVSIDFLKVVGRSDIDTIIKACGKETFLTLNNIISFSDSVNVGFHLCDGVRSFGYGSQMENLYDGIVLEGDSVDVRYDVIKIYNAKNDGFRVENIGSDLSLSLFATTILGCKNLNFNVLNSSTSISGNGFTELDKGYVHPAADFFAYLLDIKKGDEGLNIFGELHVGTPEVPTESVFGEGDSYTRNMLIYTFDGISTYTNVTDSAILVDGDCVTFPNTNVGASIYIASTVLDSAMHYGIKAYMEDSMTVGIGNVVAEYWDGSSWTEFNSLVTDADEPYLPHSEMYFEQNGPTQINYSSRMYNDTWLTSNDPGLLQSYKWIRYRITSAITQSPRIDQIKLHPERTEINKDGFITFHGDARPKNQLVLSSPRPLEGNMQSTSIYVDENVGAGLTNNTFTATADITGFPVRLPYNIDTSNPIEFLWAGRYVTGGTAQWTVRLNVVKPGDTYYTSEPAASGNTITVVLNETVTAGIREVFQVDLDISEAIARRLNDFGDEVWITIQPTTLPGNFSMTHTGAAYTSWCTGGHQ